MTTDFRRSNLIVLLDLISFDLSPEYERSQARGHEGSETDGDANSLSCEIGTEAETQSRDANLFYISADEIELALFINTVMEELGKVDDINQDGVIELCYFREERVNTIAVQDRDGPSTDISDSSPETREEQVLKLLRNGDLNSECVYRLDAIEIRPKYFTYRASAYQPQT